MTLSDKRKILEDKIKVNQAKYILDRKAAKISALSCGELKQHEYLTGEYLGHKPELVEKAKFEYTLFR